MVDEHRPAAATGDPLSFGAALGPLLRRECAGRLSEIDWFRTTWQRGGAATGFARWTADGGIDRPVIVKAPVNAAEFTWTTGLSPGGPETWDQPESLSAPTPRVAAAGRTLASHDLAWLVMERLPGQPLSAAPSAGALHDLLETAARFYERSSRVRPVAGTPPGTDWPGLLARARDNVRRHQLPEGQRWNEAIKRTQRMLPRLTAEWDSRPICVWIHGDLHPGNAMHRPREGGPDASVLIDLALVRPGHWVEDAVYLERQAWGHAEFLHGVRPVQELGRLCRDHGVSWTGDAAHLALVRRVLMAATAPASAEAERRPVFLHAALVVLEQSIPLLGH